MQMEAYQILLTPIVTEAVFDAIEYENKLVFIIHPKASKALVKQAFEEIFKIRPVKVNTTFLPDGRKKAFVKLPDDVVALDIATEFGML